MSEAQRAANRMLRERIAESGLDTQDAKLLKLQALTAPTVQKLSPVFDNRAAILIPYHRPDGAPMPPLTGANLQSKTAQTFYRLRYLGSAKGFDLVTNQPGRRYVQLQNTGVRSYFPMNLTSKSWLAVVSDVSEPLLITEGEFKAACAAKHGYACIAFGGVYSFRAVRLGYAFLPELTEIPWATRDVFIIFDSDYKTNPQVCRALKDLAEEIMERGGKPWVVSLPNLDKDRKTGLDDFIVSQGPKAFEQVLGEARPLTLAQSLWLLNESFVYVRDPGLVLDRRTDQKLSPSVFRDATQANTTHVDWQIGNDGEIKLKKKNAAADWIKWPMRADVEALTFAPGQPKIIPSESARGGYVYNTWAGWGCEPSPGPIDPFLELVDYLFGDSDNGARDWFLDWLAYPLQYPGVKLFTAAVVFGVRQGTGKSLIGYTMGRIYGRAFAEIKAADLHSSFTDWAEAKCFILADEVLGSDSRRDADLLKKLITQREMRVNTKYVPSFVIPDRANYYFTSQHPDALFLENDDRRFFVHEITCGPLDAWFYYGYDLWLNGRGPSHLFDWLLKRDVSAFNPTAPAFRTQAKSRMIAVGRSDLGDWVSKLADNPDEVLRLGERPLPGELFSSPQLLALYDPLKSSRVTANGMTRELRRQGFLQVYGGRPVNVAGQLERYFALRNADRWKNATHGEIREHLEKTTIPRDVRSGDKEGKF